MNDRDRRIATRIWPQHMREITPGPVPYSDKVQQAKQHLGDRYLLARPLNASRQKASSV